MSARAAFRLRQTVRSSRVYARQASTEATRPGSWNSLIVGGSAGLAVLGAAALASKYGDSDKRKQAFSKLAQETQQLSEAQKGAAASQPVKVAEPSTGQAVEASQSADGGEITRTQAEAGAEEEQSQQAAFNPETGEINWDCPCLGGMADGPCGPEFKEAFSCFVFSDQEPKGIDCIEKFKGMQECFRRHPDVYERELQGIDDDEEPTSEMESGSVTTVSTPDSESGSSTPNKGPEDSYVEVTKETIEVAQPDSKTKTDS